MKFFASLLAFAAAAQAHTFDSFRAQFGKEYATPQEAAHRYVVSPGHVGARGADD